MVQKQLSDFQKINNIYKCFIQSKNTYIPKNSKELNNIRYRNYALEYTNQNTKKKLTKESYCKNNKISRNSLNAGLKTLGVEFTPKKRTTENK